MPKIYIIADEHENVEDENFTKRAEELAKTGIICLLKENEIAGDETKEDIGQTFMEDRVIHEYNKVIMALAEIYPIIKIEPRLEEAYQLECMLDLFNNPPAAMAAMDQEQFSELSECCIKHLQEYAESYISFLANAQTRNPVANILLQLFKFPFGDKTDNKNVIAAFEHMCAVREQWQEQGKQKLPDEVIKLFQKNWKSFNRILKVAAELFSQYIKGRENYSEEIRNHKGISQAWIAEYFDFKFTRRVAQSLLDFDEVCVELRNQVFVDKIKSLKVTKNTWFIVGEAHLQGLRALCAQQGLAVKLIPREQKKEFLLCWNSEPNPLSTSRDAFWCPEMKSPQPLQPQLEPPPARLICGD
jgi:hypothetical protein